MVRQTILAVFIFLFISHSYSKDLPSHFPKCKRNETLTTSCLVEASNLVRDSLSKGIRELGIPSIDPLVIPSLSFEQGTRALNFKINIRNATIRGLKDYNFSEFWFDPKSLAWYNNGTIGSISLVGDCEFDGKILVIPLTGHGTISAKLDPTQVAANIKGKIINRDNVEYYKITDLKVDMPLTDGVVRFENFVGASPEIVNGINQVFSENSKEMINELAAPIQQITLDVTKILFDGITSRVPYNKMFPLV